MTYIRCPKCGQRALQVATVCPKCGAILSQNPMQAGRRGTLHKCRSCGKLVPYDATTCPFCGRVTRGRGSRLVETLLTVAVLAGLGTGAYLWLTREPAPGVAGSVPSPEPRIAAATPAPETQRTPVSPSPPSEPEPAPVAVSETVRSIPPATDTAAQRPALEAAVTMLSRDTLPNVVTKWTATWVNIREGRGTEFGIVRVLQPGTRIDVHGMRGGWWAVLGDTAVVGYIANSELADDSLPRPIIPEPSARRP